MKRDRAVTDAAKVIVRSVADARGLATLLRQCGSARLAKAVEAQLATAAASDIGATSPGPIRARLGRMINPK